MPNSETSKTYLFTWNSQQEMFPFFKSSMKDYRATGKCEVIWRCKTLAVKPGDRAFLIKIGAEPKGIIGSGTAISTVKKDIDGRPVVKLQLDTFLDPDRDEILLLQQLKKGKLGEQNWTPQASGISIREHLVEDLEKVWHDFQRDENPSTASRTNSREATETYIEGAPRKVTLTAYERNRKARIACIKHYGLSCAVCDFNFGAAFGKIGRGYIEVHHLIPVSSIKEGYEVDFIKDLRPVCPNCHEMLHRTDPPLTIGNLKRLVKNRRARL